MRPTWKVEKGGDEIWVIPPASQLAHLFTPPVPLSVRADDIAYCGGIVMRYEPGSWVELGVGRIREGNTLPEKCVVSDSAFRVYVVRSWPLAGWMRGQTGPGRNADRVPGSACAPVQWILISELPVRLGRTSGNGSCVT